MLQGPSFIPELGEDYFSGSAAPTGPFIAAQTARAGLASHRTMMAEASMLSSTRVSLSAAVRRP